MIVSPGTAAAMVETPEQKAVRERIAAKYPNLLPAYPVDPKITGIGFEWPEKGWRYAVIRIPDVDAVCALIESHYENYEG